MGSTTYGARSLGVGNFVGNWITHVNFIAQNIDDGWTRFMLEKSDGFKRAGIERIIDSIRTFIYCLLGAQVQARTSIISQSGTSHDAQKKIIKTFEDAINVNLSILDSIERYQKIIKNNNIIKNNDIVTTREDSIYKIIMKIIYILPLIVGGSIGLIIYFIK